MVKQGFILVLLATVCLPPCLMAQGPTLDQTVKIRDLIQRLGDDRFATREAAQTELAKFGELARSALTKAASDSDSERAARAKALLERLGPLTHRILDAVDQPIAHAKIVLLTGNPRDPLRSPPKFATAEGQVSLTDLQPGVILEISHPRYGIGRAQQPISPDRLTPKEPEGRPTMKRLPAYRAPLVQQGSLHRQRAVTGTVLDPQGRPLRNATVHCQTARTAGMGLIQADFPVGKAVTDADGKFALYLPNQPRVRGKVERGEMIPPQTQYELQIESTREDCFPLHGMFSNHQPVRIQLPKADKQHEFRFAIRNQEPVSSKDLAQVFVTYQGPNNQRATLNQNDIQHGRRLAPGVYHAHYHFNGGSLRFLPLHVNADSPKVLIFKTPEPITFRGRVIHGVTAKPIPRAWIAGYFSTAYNNLAVLTDEQWDKLRADENLSNPNGYAMETLNKHYGIRALTRADKQGQFEITQDPAAEFFGIVAFAQDFVPMTARRDSVQVQDHRGDFGPLTLFPAAKVMVNIKHAERVSAMPTWMIAKDAPGDWLEAFRAIDEDSSRSIAYVHWMKRNESAPIYVPSDIPLKVKFETPYDDKWGPVLSQSLQLKQGETFDLGTIEFPKSAYAAVRVIGPDGAPLEGVPVRRMHEGMNAWSVAHNTNEKGEAYFYVHPNSRGKFRALQLRDEEIRKAKNLAVSFDADQVDAEQPITIQLTKEQLKYFENAAAKSNE